MNLASALIKCNNQQCGGGSTTLQHYKNEPWQLNSRQLCNTELLCLFSVDKMPFVTASGVQVNFPFDPYPCQVTYMEKVVTCLKEVTYETIIKSHFGDGKMAQSWVH